MKHGITGIEALELYLKPKEVLQEKWEVVYKEIEKCLDTLSDDEIANQSHKATIHYYVNSRYIHVFVKRAFTTDVILLYSKLSNYENQECPLVLMGVLNEHGKTATPIIMELLVLLKHNFPKGTSVKGYIHPDEVKNAYYRLKMRGHKI
ncbi:hypothetical protein [Alteribacillus sp. HJP-4]|uniref:hypothetical protein n=1 Tax=Alteribacillus sp. HJP-4 TaxID=2775394 RepID=UPI0035CD3749